MYTLLRAFSLRLVFPSFVVFSRKLWPGKFRKKTHFTRDTGKEKEKRLTPAIVIFLLSFGTFLFIMWYTRARESLSLFSISTKGRSRSSSRLSLDRRARVLVFIARKELERLLYLLFRFVRAFCARPKKSPPKLSSASRDPSFFITTTRFQKSGSLFGSMTERERERERLSSSFVVEEVRSIDRSIDRLLRAFFFFAHKLSSYQQQLWKTGTFWAFDHTPLLNQERVFIPNESFWIKKV